MGFVLTCFRRLSFVSGKILTFFYGEKARLHIVAELIPFPVTLHENVSKPPKKKSYFLLKGPIPSCQLFGRLLVAHLLQESGGSYTETHVSFT